MADEIVREKDGDQAKSVTTSAKISPSRSLDKSQSRNVRVTSEIDKKCIDNPISVSVSPKDKIIIDEGATMTTLQRKSRSACRSRSRDPKKCQKNFREMIGKHEMRNEELEQLEGDLRDRLDMLECSMPAVMVWNILRTAQGAPPSAVRRLMEKQLEGVHAAGNVAIPSTPSQHYDCRVREIEAERKEALRRAEEARALLTDKEAAVEERRKRLEEAKKCNRERKERVAKLNRESAELREAMKNARGDDRSCETGECGEIRCKEKFLGDIGSLSSICSTDLECFAKLEELAESEVCMKRQISELERREEAYMRTLQQADELWSKMEGDNFGSVSELQKQLDLKTTANQKLAERICQLEDEVEKLKKRLTSCSDELGKFTGKEYADAEAGFTDGVASVADRGIVAGFDTATASVSASPQTVNADSTVHPETMDKESSFAAESDEKGVSVHSKMSNKESEAIVDQIEREVDRPDGLGIEAGVGDAQIGRLDDPGGKEDSIRKSKSNGSNETGPDDQEEISDAWENWNWDDGCPPDAVCNDMIESSTGTNNMQLAESFSTTQSEVQATVEMAERPVGGREPEDMAEIVREVEIPAKDNIEKDETNDTGTIHETALEIDQITLSREELRNWYNIVKSIHHTITKCINCKSELDATVQLMGKMNNHLWILAFVDSKDPITGGESAKSSTFMAKIPTEILQDLNTETTEYKGSTQSLSVAATKPVTESHTTMESKKFDEDISRVREEDTKLSEEKLETMDISISKTTVQPEAKPDSAKPSGTVDEILEPLQPQTDITELDADDGTLHEASLQAISQDKIEEVVEPPAGEINDNEEQSLALAVSVKEELPGPLAEEPESQKISDMIVSRSETVEALPKSTGSASDIKEDLADIPKVQTVSEVAAPPEAPKQDISISRNADANFEKSMEGLEESLSVTSEANEIVQLVAALETLNELVNDEKIEDATGSLLIPRAPTSTVIDVQPEIQASSLLDSRDKPTLLSSSDIVPEITSGESRAETQTSSLLDTSDKPKLPSSPDVISAIASGKSQAEIEASSLLDSRDKPTLSSSSDVVPALTPSFKLEIPAPTEESSSIKIDDSQEMIDGTLEGVVRARPLSSSQKLEAPAVPATIEAEYKEPFLTIVSEAEQRESVPSSIAKDDDTMEFERKHEVSDITPSDEAILEKSAEKLPEKTVSEGKSMEMSEQETADKSLVSVAKVESEKKKQLPESVDTCNCASSTGLPVIEAASEPKTEGTQTSPQLPRTLDRIKLKTIAESTWRSPDVVMWRRPLIWPRRRKDKSTLTTVCVDTQTDSALVRERIKQRGIDRKDDCACSGIGPRKIEFGDSHERVSSHNTDERLPAPVGRPVTELFDSPRLPTSTASTEKEISVTRYTDNKPLLSMDSELHCVECGRPLTPEDTSLALKAGLRASTKSQRSLMQTLKKIATSSASRMARKKDDFTCCECKMLDKPKTDNASRMKRGPDKSLDEKICGEEFCCPCPSGVTKKIPTESSKPSRKRRKPEKKDQSVTAKIPRNKFKKNSKEKRTMNDADANVSIKERIKESSNECCASSKTGSKIVSSSSKTVSKIVSSSSKMGSRHSGGFITDCSVGKSLTEKSGTKADGIAKELVAELSSANVSSQCGCGEDNDLLVPYTNYSSIFRSNIAKDDNSCSCGNKSTMKGNICTCDCSSIESVTKERAACAGVRK